MGIRSIQPSPFLSKILGTMATSMLTIVCLVVMTSALAKGLGSDQFGAFSLVRRILNTLEPFITISLAISLSRYVALTRNNQARIEYMRAGFIILTVMLLITLLPALFFAEELAGMIFHQGDEYLKVYKAMLFLIAGYSIYILLYAYYRGVENMLWANLWQTAVIGIGPMTIAILLAKPENLALIIYLNGILLGVGILPVLKIIRISEIGPGSASTIRGKAIRLVKYGLPRVPGSFIYGGLMTAGPLAAQYYGSLRDAGYIVIGQSILKIYESGIETFGRVALPKISNIFNEYGKAGLRERITDLICIILDLGMYLTIHSLVWTGAIIYLWLGTGYGDATMTVRIITIPLIPYLIYVTLRVVLDAIEEKAVTTGYLVAAFMAMIASSALFIWIGMGVISLAIGTSIALFVLGYLVLHRICVDLAIEFRSIVNVPMIVLNIVLGAIALGMERYVYGKLSGTFAKCALVGAVEVACFLCYAYFLRRSDVRWWRPIQERLLSGKVI